MRNVSLKMPLISKMPGSDLGDYRWIFLGHAPKDRKNIVADIPSNGKVPSRKILLRSMTYFHYNKKSDRCIKGRIMVFRDHSTRTVYWMWSSGRVFHNFYACKLT